MSTTQHTPGRVCDACEGFCLLPARKVDAGVEISLRIGQRVRHTDYQGQRVTGVVHGLAIDQERGLMVDCVLDAPIVISGDSRSPAINIHRQYAPAYEFALFDDRDEVIAELLQALQSLHDKTAELIAHLKATDRLRPCFNLPALESAGATITKATRSGS